MTATVLTPIKLRRHLFKGCRRCGGDLRMERDHGSLLDPDAVEYVCLQCGRRTPLAARLDGLPGGSTD